MEVTFKIWLENDQVNVSIGAANGATMSCTLKPSDADQAAFMLTSLADEVRYKQKPPKLLQLVRG